MDETEIEFCCGGMRLACEDETDSEAYGPLAEVTESGRVSMGRDSWINFCPFCGRNLLDNPLKVRVVSRLFAVLVNRDGYYYDGHGLCTRSADEAHVFNSTAEAVTVADTFIHPPSVRLIRRKV